MVSKITNEQALIRIHSAINWGKLTTTFKNDPIDVEDAFIEENKPGISIIFRENNKKKTKYIIPLKFGIELQELGSFSRLLTIKINHYVFLSGPWTD